jgi:hypothetical protein
MSKARGNDVKKINQVRAWVWRIFAGNVNRNNLWFNYSYNDNRFTCGLAIACCAKDLHIRVNFLHSLSAGIKS